MTSKTETLEWMTHDDELGLSVEDIGLTVHKIAAWIDKAGNKGFSDSYLKTAGLPVNILLTKYSLAWESIVFYAEGRRRRDPEGWMVRRNPPWQHAWAKRYGWDNEIGRILLDELHEKALADDKTWTAERERIRLNRPESFALGKYADYSDIELEYLVEALDILESRWDIWRLETRTDKKLSVWLLLSLLVDKASQGIKRELYLRHYKMPEFLEPNMPVGYDIKHKAFTREFWSAAVHQAGEPDLRVDMAALPHDVPEKRPVMRMSDADVMRSFMVWLAADGDEFAREDQAAIMRTLRKMFARAKGQHGAAGADLAIDDTNQDEEG